MLLELFIPFYGDVTYFKYAINSILGQTDPDWQLTIFDDQYPSTVPQEFIEQLGDPRIKYFRNSSNLGITKNFQQCVDAATADFITILGCDDALLPNYVQRMKQIIFMHPDLSYIQPGVRVIDENSALFNPLGDKVKLRLRNRFAPPTIVSGEELAASISTGCWTYFPSIAWNTSAIRQHSFKEKYRIVLDVALQLDIITSQGRVFVDDQISFEYRRHRKSASMASATDSTRFAEEAELYSEFATHAESLGWRKAAKSARFHTTSRINAALELPRAVLTGNQSGAMNLLRHIFGKW